MAYSRVWILCVIELVNADWPNHVPLYTSRHLVFFFFCSQGLNGMMGEPSKDELLHFRGVKAKLWTVSVLVALSNKTTTRVPKPVPPLPSLHVWYKKTKFERGGPLPSGCWKSVKIRTQVIIPWNKQFWTACGPTFCHLPGHKIIMNALENDSHTCVLTSVNTFT